MKTLLIYVSLVVVFSGCSSSIKMSSDAKLKLEKHQVIAILPFEVRFDLRNNNKRQFTDKEIAEVRHFMATGLQEHLYYWLTSFKKQKTLSVEIQHVVITDSILNAKQIRFMDLYNMSRVELAGMLGVDAVLTPNVIFAQPNSEAASLAFMIGFRTFEGLPTQEMRMQILLNDNKSDTAFWKFKTTTKSDALTKRSKDRKKENILYPLFRNIDESLVKFIKKFPYRN